MLITSELAFEIAGISLLYRYSEPIVVEEDWPIHHFLCAKDEYDIINDISFEPNFGYKQITDKAPAVAMPSYSIYLQDELTMIVFTPGTPNPVAISVLYNGYSSVRTIVMDRSYTKQPLPLCVTGFLLQYVLATRNEGFIMHGATWTNETNGTGIVFTGNSGVGKSTISQIFRENTTWKQISDDRIFVKISSRGYRAFGNPFDYKIQRISNESTDIKHLFFLHHSSENCIKAVEHGEKIRRLLTICLLPYWDSIHLRRASVRLSNFSQGLKMYDLYFRPDNDIVSLVLKTIDTI